MLKKPGRLPDETPPLVQQHVGGPRPLRRLERATDAARAAWLRAGGPLVGAAFEEYGRAWTTLAAARQARIRRSEEHLTPQATRRSHERIRRELDTLRHRREEWAIIFDRGGCVLWRGTSGQPEQVRYPGDDLPGRQFREHWRGAILTHNHPLDLSLREWPGFGDSDLRALVISGVAESWALYPFGLEWRRAIVRPPRGGWQHPVDELQQRLGEAHAAALERQLQSYPEASSQVSDVWAEALAELGNQGLLQFVLETGR